VCSQIYIKMITNLYFSYGFSSKIWVNLPRDDCYFFHIFLLMITTLVTNKFFFLKTLVVNSVVRGMRLPQPITDQLVDSFLP